MISPDDRPPDRANGFCAMICARRAAVALSCLATALTVAGVAVLALRFRRSRMAALRLAQAAYARWIAHPDDLRASTNYYRCLARLVKWFDALPVERRAEACRDAGLVVEMDPMEEIGLFRFTVADKVPLYRLTRSHTRSGIGVPVVAWRPNDGSDRWDTLRPPEGIFAPATAVLAREDADRWALRFLSPYSRETVIVEGHTYALAAHFSAPLAKLVRRAEALRRSAFRGMLDPSVIVRREKLYVMQRYDRKRIPLLMVHGLMSTPISFANLTNDLFADPLIHARYQIWHYYYPTGTPLLQNAAILRRILKETLSEIDPPGSDFATNHLVVLGHSMGGLIAHTLISDSGYKLWDSVITVRPEAFRCDVKTGNVLNAVFLFEREKRIRRAILISVPHRGSPIARNWIGSLGQSLYRADRELQEAFWTLVENHLDQINPFFSGPLKKGKLSAIHTLSVNSPVLMALAEIPPAIPFHSIIGQINVGPRQTGHDGVVAYSSSHLDGAESEAIVHFGHETFLHPDAVTEIKRILRLHLETL